MDRPGSKTEILKHLLKYFVFFLIGIIILAIFIDYGLEPIISWNDLSPFAKIFYFLSYAALSAAIIGTIVTLIGFFKVLFKT